MRELQSISLSDRKIERRRIVGNTDLKIACELARAFVLLVDGTELDYMDSTVQSLMKDLSGKLPIVTD